MTRTVMICIDGSPLAVQAARAGLSVLGPSDEVVVVTVIEPVDLALGAQVSGFAGSTVSPEEFDRGRQAMVDDADAAVAAAVAELGLPDARTQVLQGDPGTSLCDFASTSGADVMVIGSRGRSGFKRAILGSVSDHVVRHAPCPVLITSASED